MRSLLILGRVSNLPTVWSNCLAGWLLGGGGDIAEVVLLAAGASLLYTAGMYLNDAFDVEFDWQFRPERPIPSGAIGVRTVWILGIAGLAAGVALMFPLGKTTALTAILLAGNIFLYDAVHKTFALAPVLMAGCRLLLVLAAAAAGDYGIDGISLWSGIALAIYVIGLSYLARTESTHGFIGWWPILLLAAPLVLAFFVNDGFHRHQFFVLGGVLVIWLARCLYFAFWSSPPNMGKAVSGLIAGIALVDLLAVGGYPEVFVACFLLSLFLQRFIPAT